MTNHNQIMGQKNFKNVDILTKNEGYNNYG